jgi:hypothetical protein
LRRLLRSVSADAALAAGFQLAEFFRPVLVVWGTAQNGTGPAIAGRLLATFPNASAACLEGAATDLPEERPRQLAVTIDEFIATTIDASDIRFLKNRTRSSPVVVPRQTSAPAAF